MDFGLLDYCLQPSPFFDLPIPSVDGDFDQVRAALPGGWLGTTDEVWVYQHPSTVPCREQGWKVHVSTTPDQAQKVLDIVHPYCVERALPFKHLRSRAQVMARNSKYADRTASGKFIAIYPPSEDDLPGILADLELSLAGFSGPSVLTDLRYGTAPVYVRYGAFVELTGRDEQGHLVPSIRRPDGVLVPDLRRTSFHTPDWVSLPECLVASLDRRRAGATRLPVQVTRALHFSNGGGVYDAVDRESGARVLLKEARPWAGLDEEGNDAVARLEVEKWALDELAGCPAVPAAFGYLRGHEHYYLMREYVDGESLLTEIQRRHPDLPGSRSMTREAYTDWALTIADAVDVALTDMHRRGVAFGDVHPNNVLLGDDGRPRFIDLETASPVAEGRPQRIGAPGFRAPAQLGGVAADRYALACVRLSLFLPSTITLSWREDAVHDLLDEIHRRFDGDPAAPRIPQAYDEAVLADLGLISPSLAQSVVPDGDAVSEFVLAQATPARLDRLYPGAANAFRTPGGGVTPGYGAAGVMWALAQRGTSIPTSHREWLLSQLPDLECSSGLYEGWAGLACALVDLGHEHEGLAALARALEADVPDRTLTRGLTGAGLAALRFGVQSPTLAPTALAAATDIGHQLVREGAWTTLFRRSGGPAWGLLDGPAGVALLLTMLEDAAPGEGFRVAAREALTVELDRLFPGTQWAAPLSKASAPGPWQRATLHRGSAGAAVALAAHLDRGDDEEMANALARLEPAHDLWHHEQPGLFTGRAGMIAAIRRVNRRWAGASGRIAEQVRLLRLHTITGQGVCGHLGDHGLKMSCDLGSGSAGIVWVTEGGTLPLILE